MTTTIDPIPPVASAAASPEPLTRADTNGAENDTLIEEFVLLDTLRCKDLMSTEKGPLYRTQMCSILDNQEKRCLYYKKYFEDLNNLPMSTQFAAHAAATQKFIKLLDDDPEHLPKTTYESVKFSGVPFNPDVKEREVQLIVKAYSLPENAHIIVVAEFEFPNLDEESLKTSLMRWYRQTIIEPKNLFYTLKGDFRQYDTGLIEELVHFSYSSDAKGTMRPMRFFVDKGKSRTHKRKYKPIKLYFYQRNGVCKRELLGTALVKIDQIADESTFRTRVAIGKARNKVGLAEVSIRVREPLVNKTPRPIEEKILCFI